MENKKSCNLAKTIKDETFDMESEQIRKLGYQAVDLIADYFKGMHNDSILPDNTIHQMKELMQEPLPQNEQNPHDILDECQKKIIANAVRIGNPRMLGWVLASGTVIGAFADGIAGAINQNVAVSGATASTAIEMLAINWIKEMLGYDSKAAGILVSGGSVANLTALAVARNMKAKANVRSHGMEPNNNMVLYVSEEVHMCIPKAAHILGIGTNNIRNVKTDENYSMDVNDLEPKIIEDKRNNKHPFAVVATAGTVNTGAIDPLDSIADICHTYNLWFHIDAAYGGFATLSPTIKPLLKGIIRADSVALDPHKWLFIPFEAGCVLVKNPSNMIQTFASNANYIHTDNDKIPNSEDIDFSDYGLQLSRNFRALKIWMSIKQYGVKKYGRLIDQNVQLTQYFAALIEESRNLELVTPASLSVVCFRYFPEDLKEKYQNSDKFQKEKILTYLNTLNKSIAKAMRIDGRALLSSTVLGNIFVLRACIVNYRTTKQDIEEIIKIIHEIGDNTDKDLRERS